MLSRSWSCLVNSCSGRKQSLLITYRARRRALWWMKYDHLAGSVKNRWRSYWSTAWANAVQVIARCVMRRGGGGAGGPGGCGGG